MNPQEISFDRYNSIQKEVGKYNDIQSALKEAYELIKGVVVEKEKNKKNPDTFKKLEELQKKFVKEYIDLENSIKESIKDDKNISIEERKRIMFELSDIVDLAEKNNIKEHKNLWSRLGDIKRSIGGNDEVDTDKVKAEAIKLNEKKELITRYFKKEKFTETELKKLLTISNEDRKRLREYKIGNTAGKLATRLGLDSTSADIFLSQEEVIRTNQFQDDIIKRIGLEKGYNGIGDIHAYHPSLGNYITNVNNVESALKINSVQNLGNKALNNYIGFLESKGELTIKNLKTKFGEEKTQEIFDFIKRNTDKDGKKIFDDSFVNKVINLFDKALKALEEKINGLFNKLNSSKNIEDFKNNLQEIKNYDKDEKTELIKKFDKEIQSKESALKKLFFEPVKAKLIEEGKTEAEANKEAEKITNDILNDIKSNIGIVSGGKIFTIIEKFKKDYPDTKFSSKDAAAKAASYVESEHTRNAVEHTRLADEARRNGDPEGARKHDQNARTSMVRASEAKNVGKIVNKISEQEAIDIGTGKLDYKKHLEKILSEDENLRIEIENLEKEKNKIQIIKNNFNDVENPSSNTKIETTSYSYDTDSGVASINLPNGNQNVSLSPEEKIMVKSNPETLNNIVDFYKTLNELGLSDLWQYREKIFITILNKIGIGFKIGTNYSNENQVKIFLNSILKSVGEEKIDQNKTIGEFKNIFSQKNDLQIIGNGYKDNLMTKGSSKISEKFLEKFVTGRPFFATNDFSKSLQ